MNPGRTLIMAIGFLCVLALTAAADVPQMINYQGRLTDSGGDPVSDGDYDVRFEIWDSPAPSETDIMLWTSGTVTVAVSNGLFTHMLGSAYPLPPSVFVYDGPLGRYIATEIIGQGVTPPRLPLLATPYAYQAIKSDTAGYALAGAGGGGYWQPGLGGGIYYDDGNVGIGTSRPAHALDVHGDINTTTLYRSNGATILKDLGSFSIALGIHAGETGSSETSTFLGHNAGQFGIGLENTFVGAHSGRNNAGTRNTFIGAFSGNDATGSRCVFLGDSAGYYEDSDNKLVIDNAVGVPLIYGDFSTNKLGIGTTTLNYTLNVSGEIHTFGTTSGLRFASPGGVFPTTFRLYGSNGYARLWNSLGGELLTISLTGNTAIGGSTGEPHRLYVEGASDLVSGATAFFRNTHESGIALLADNTSDDATAVFVNYGDGDALRCFKGVGSAWNLTFAVTSWGRVICNELELLGGADLAEPFAMSGGEVPVGALVVIDSDNPGKLKLSHRAYDTRVAGVVSGAGGVKPGLTLSQKSIFEDGQNVAINGRVYCLADASYGSIKPGDLLTTSNTPGHAMRASDRNRAYGAVIGKAMSELNQETGLVLVLVNLQ